jgi:hypothetical protein
MIRRILYKAFSSIGSAEVRRFEQASQNCALAQKAKLFEIIGPNINTEYGRQHQFRLIKTVADFQKAVPINNYDNLSASIERMASGESNILTAEDPFMFATTSGTTGARKLIPVNKSYLKEFRRASVISGHNLLSCYPDIAGGVALSIFSPAEEGRTEGNLPYGAISGRLYLTEPALIKRYISPIPYEVFLIKDYEARYYTLLRCALVLPVSVIYTLNPSTIALLARRLEKYAESLINDIRCGTLTPPGLVTDSTRKAISFFLSEQRGRAGELLQLLKAGLFRADRVWPSLSLISCWTKAAASFYLQDFPTLYGAVPVCDITYGASEGRGTVGIGRDKQALAIRSHFFEFVEEDQIEQPNPQTLTADQLQTGKNYFILFTTSAGLYRYNLNDIVQVVGWHNQTPLLEFLHKGGNVSSFTGEKLTESQVTQAVLATTAELKLVSRFFTVLPQFRPDPHYLLLIETTEQLSEQAVQDCALQLDLALARANSEYLAKRQSKRLAPATAYALRSGTYEEVRKLLVDQGVPDAQIKISHLNPKAEVRDLLLNRITSPEMFAIL